MPVSLAHRQRMLQHLERQEMGLKYTVETIGELRKALAHVPDDAPFQLIDADGGDFRKLEVQSLYDREPELFVKFTIAE